mmetsp:Transcript_22770/g.86260  ORF Transcript_22770/g.86260 Transcript_22770/m.86260 type:complete len:226 (+) Transcript_22770:2071-2748(+)
MGRSWASRWQVPAKASVPPEQEEPPMAVTNTRKSVFGIPCPPAATVEGGRFGPFGYHSEGPIMLDGGRTTDPVDEKPQTGSVGFSAHLPPELVQNDPQSRLICSGEVLGCTSSTSCSRRMARGTMWFATTSATLAEDVEARDTYEGTMRTGAQSQSPVRRRRASAVCAGARCSEARCTAAPPSEGTPRATVRPPCLELLASASARSWRARRLASCCAFSNASRPS